MRPFAVSAFEPDWQILDSGAVKRLLPQRAPFLFVDYAHVNVAGDCARTWRRFRPDEPYFEGHFPGNPIVPGVVLLECMAQAGRLVLNAKANRIRAGYLVGVDGAKFSHPVRPDEMVRVDAHVHEARDLVAGKDGASIHAFKCAAFVGDRRCARAQVTLYRVGLE